MPKSAVSLHLLPLVTNKQQIGTKSEHGTSKCGKNYRRLLDYQNIWHLIWQTWLNVAALTRKKYNCKYSSTVLFFLHGPAEHRKMQQICLSVWCLWIQRHKNHQTSLNTFKLKHMLSQRLSRETLEIYWLCFSASSLRRPDDYFSFDFYENIVMKNWESFSCNNQRVN